MIKLGGPFEKVGGLLNKLERAAADGTFDRPVEVAAWKAHRRLVELTPKKWTGNTRRGWTVTKPENGVRLVSNNTKVMRWLEDGTGNAGTPTSHGGRIYPATKKFLFIPLVPSAMYGWVAGMKFGIDYILARSVRGIKAMNIVKNFRPTAATMLKSEMKAFLKKMLT